MYDAGGELLISRNTTGDGDTVLYLGGGSEVRLTTKGTTKTLVGTRYYTAAGKTIAVRTATLGTTGSKLSFLAGDHHGTSSLAIDSATSAVTKRYTTPFGAPRGSAATTWPDDKAFLGKPADIATGLTHIGAREYDPGIGQFVSVAPLLSLDQHQSLNGYSYANNRPPTGSDPTGLRDPGGAQCGVISACTGGGPEWQPEHKPSGGSGGGGGGGGGKGGGGTASAPSGGGGKGGGSDCGFWSKCGWVNALDDAGNWIGDNKGMIASVVTEVVVGGACFGAAAGAGLATGGVGFGAAAGCGAVAGAAGNAIGNAFDDNADHSVSGQLSAQAEGAIWGAAGAGAFYGLGEAAKLLAKCHSFLPGTGVLLADGTRRAIEDIDVGDTVVTTDTKTGKTTRKKVVSTITTEDDKDFTEITIFADDDYSSIVATDAHPFWVRELQKWVPAGDLNPGQWLRTSAGTHVQITATTHYTKPQRTHDLTIQDIHAYYVLADVTPLLVHNCGKSNWTPDENYSPEAVAGRSAANKEYYSVHPDTHALVSRVTANPGMSPRLNPDGSVDRFEGNNLSGPAKKFWGSWKNSPIYWNGQPKSQIRIMINEGTGQIAHFPLTKQGVHNYGSPSLYKWK